MMNEHDIKRCMDQRVKHISVSPRQHEQMLQTIVKGEEKVKKKISAAMVFAAVLLLAATSALALTVLEMVRPQMDAMTGIVLEDNWSMETKLRLIDLMKEYGLAMDDGLMAVLEDTAAEVAEKEEAADRLLDAAYGAIDHAELDPTILQQEEYASPSLEAMFTVLYRQHDRDAAAEEIEQAFIAWEAGYAYPPAELVKEIDATSGEEDIREHAESYLSEVISLSKKERAACTYDIAYHAAYDLWLAEITVPAAEIRPEWKAEHGLTNYDEETDTYRWLLDYGPEDSLAAYVLAEGAALPLTEHIVSEVMMALIPDDAWLYMEQQQNRARCFDRFTVEERAAFSAVWKPVVDDFLAENPAFDAYFRTHSHLDEAYTMTRHVYGIPDAGMVTEDKACELARNAYLTAGLQGVSDEMIDNRCRIVALYDVTDAGSPVWKVAIDYDAYESARWVESDHKDGYAVKIDPVTEAISVWDRSAQHDDDSAFAYAERYR